MGKGRKKYDKIQEIKRTNRVVNKTSGAGPHSDKREVRVQKKSTTDYLAEVEEELEDEEEVN